MTELRKCRLLTEWIAFCQYIGWKKADLPFLADLFWQYEGWKTFKGWRHP